MKQQIYCYRLYLFNKKEDEYIELTQEQGQLLEMSLASDPNRKFVLIGDDIVNTSAIEQVVRHNSMVRVLEQGGSEEIKEIRELTEKEKTVQVMFNKFKNKKLLN